PADTAEFARAGALLAPRLHDVPVGIHLGDALVQLELRGVVIPVLILHAGADVAELARLMSGRAAELAQFLALGSVEADAVVVRVADDEVAVAVDGEVAGAAVAVVGRCPGRADVLAIEVEDLHAGGVVNDVEPVAGNGRGARADEHAVANPAL